jgi:hypothetical protein
MIVFRWVLGALLALLAGGAVLSFVLFMALDINVWLDRARSLRRGAYLTMLFWFNVEIWGRIVYTIIHW